MIEPTTSKASSRSFMTATMALAAFVLSFAATNPAWADEVEVPGFLYDFLGDDVVRGWYRAVTQGHPRYDAPEIKMEYGDETDDYEPLDFPGDTYPIAGEDYNFVDDLIDQSYAEPPDPSGPDLEGFRKNLQDANQTRSNPRQPRRRDAKAPKAKPAPESSGSNEPPEPDLKTSDYNILDDDFLDKMYEDPPEPPEPDLKTSGPDPFDHPPIPGFSVTAKCSACVSKVDSVNTLSATMRDVWSQMWVMKDHLDNTSSGEPGSPAFAVDREEFTSIEEDMHRLSKVLEIVLDRLEKAQRELKECEKNCDRRQTFIPPPVETIYEDRSVATETTDYDCGVKPYTGPTKRPQAQQALIDNYNAHCLQQELRQAINRRQGLDQERKDSREGRGEEVTPDGRDSLRGKARAKAGGAMQRAARTRPRPKPTPKPTSAMPGTSQAGTSAKQPTADAAPSADPTTPATASTFTPPAVETVDEERTVKEEVSTYDCGAKPYTGPTRNKEAQQALIDNYNANCN